MQNTYYTGKKRLFSLSVITIFLFLLIFFRLGYIQVIWGETLQARAMDQWTRSLSLMAERGNILDREGRVVAQSYTTYGVYVRAKSVTDPEAVAAALSRELGLDYDLMLKKATNKGISEQTIKRQVSAETAAKIRSLNLDGIYFAAESGRDYVYGDFLSQVLGFVSIDNIGQMGIEAFYDKYLRGIDGLLLTPSDLIGKELENDEILYVPSVPGLDVILTIDYYIQSAVENVLELIMRAHSAKSAKCIVLDVQTGEILAMSQKPSMDLNNLDRSDVAALMELSRNTLVTDVYEPGSTFKILTVAASLEEFKRGNPAAFGSDYVFTNNSGSRIVPGGKINCWTKHTNGKHSNQTLAMALANSCNPIFTDIALSLGIETYYKYLNAFGYGTPTGIDFMGDNGGILINENTVTLGDLARIGFGQSIAVTALQLCMATAAAVNGGKLLQPQLVKEIVDSNTGTTVKQFTPTVLSNPISAETSALIAQMLRNVVQTGGGKNADIPGYQIAGKTGTAQKYVNGAIAQGKYVSSFIGVFPASQPKYLVLMLVDEPVGQSYGSLVAAPYAKVIFQQLINYYNLPPVE